MKRALKWFAGFGAVVVLLVVVAAIALPRLVDTPRVQAMIAASAAQAVGRPVKFESRGGQREDVGLNRGIARGQLPLIGVVQLEIRLQHEDVLGPVMPGERRIEPPLRGRRPQPHRRERRLDGVGGP